MGETLSKSYANGTILLEVELGYLHTLFSVFGLHPVETRVLSIG